MDSQIGLITQLAGVFLIAVLTMCLRQSLKRIALRYWATAWLSLLFALICLRLAISYEQYSNSLISMYFLGEYIFGFMLVAGCQSVDRDTDIRPFAELLILPLALIAIALPVVAIDANTSFGIHTLILSGFFVYGFILLVRSQPRSFGWMVMSLSLVLLAFLHIFNFAIAMGRATFSIWEAFLNYNAISETVLQTALGFGMVIVLLERMLADSRLANEKLEDEHRMLENLVHTDPLTAAFNRHAFYGFVRKGKAEVASGCIGFFDIDDLKWINDRYGHAVGDHAIRAVVRAIREIIRAEDLIYRWGGDEFFVIMISMNAEMAQARMLRLEGLLTNVMLNDMSEPISIGVSCGFTDFEDANKLEQAINQADSEMYRRKQLRKHCRRQLESALIPPAEIPIAVEF